MFADPGSKADKTNSGRASKLDAPPQASGIVQPPTLSLPKGGGAIRGMGEKFAANSVTGTGSMSVPIAASPGRGGFGPQLALAYDSGAGNGPFGFGWNLSLPTITRKTDKGLPRYNDAAESDIFLLSGAEDLVPVLVQTATGEWEPERVPPRTIDSHTYIIKRYRPRIEGLFARLERWTREDGDIHWRSLTRDNILTLYGKDANARIADPEDATRVFSWLICETRDDKGNAILYQYKPEDVASLDLAQAHEANRGRADDRRRRSNRYIKRILYGNNKSLLDEAGHRPPFLGDEQVKKAAWLFEVVFDYGEHDSAAPTPSEIRSWPVRRDPFSAYRAGFEVRTYRLCQRVLMFHHFPDEDNVGANCLVRSTDFTFRQDQAEGPIYAFLIAATHAGYVRQGVGYLKRSLPPVEFEYTRPVVQSEIEEVDAASLENLPTGLDGAGYQWIDLHGEGIPGILTEQGGAWFYKRNTSPINLREHGARRHVEAQFAPVELVAAKPNLSLGGAQFMDLAGDGQPDLVVMDGPLSGLYEHDEAEKWGPFRPFNARLNRAMNDPNLRFVDLDGDGHSDVLITENDAFVWHPSLAEDGFGPAQRVVQALDEERGPRLVFADGEQAIYLADLSGDGLTDLARIRNGEVCYWPNLGYGRFGAKVTMDNAPMFDRPDQFEQRHIRLADIDGSGTTDILYLHRDGVRLYFNQSGNSWSAPQVLGVFPSVDSLVDIQATDLLGNGTVCLVWSSPLPGDGRRPMRYVNLMGDQKPHLLVKTVNNLGAETRVHYAPSTQFYLQDKRAGQPWITKLPFPVHVVERVETFDHISRNRFVTRYAYHHGFFDGVEREFRGFGRVEQLDTEEFAALRQSDAFPIGDNVDAASHVPPVLTKTWFHTGVQVGRDHISDFFAGLLDEADKGEYYRESGLNDDEARALLLPDTILPDGLTAEEEREACRSLKGAMLRQEVYALDGTDKAKHPYSVTEHNFTIRPLQPQGDNPFAVFFTHPREAISYHYERNPADPRIQHALTLEVDEFGNVLKAAAIGYGRRKTVLLKDENGQFRQVENPELQKLDRHNQEKQTQPLITYAENRVTNSVNLADDYRTPLPVETRTYELTGIAPENNADRFAFDEWMRDDFRLPTGAVEIPYEQLANPGSPQKRLIERVRSLYRKDDLSALLPPGELEPLALPGESYKLAFTPGLLVQVYQRNGENLLPDLSAVLPVDTSGNLAADRGGYVDLDGDGHGWIPGGRVFFSPAAADDAAAELTFARNHFFTPHRYRDPFHTSATSTESTVTFDDHVLLMVATRDALGNTVHAASDYRVLSPRLMTDPNGNRSEVSFDALGMVAGTAVMGKEHEPDGQPKGDSLKEFAPDLTLSALDAFIAQPRRPSTVNREESEVTDIVRTLLKDATTRIVYDLDRFSRLGEPPFAATIVREKHFHDLAGSEQSKLQVSFSYSDGFGREIQKKIQAESGPVPQRDAEDKIIMDVAGQPMLTLDPVRPRWVGSGWTVFNNKGKPVRQYEPFFTDRHRFEFDVRIGVSPVLFYDPVERVVATLHPDHTWEKVVFDPWQQTTFDVNDTVTFEPQADLDVGGFFTRLPTDEYLPTWHAQRSSGGLGPDERNAAQRAAAHADTPTTAHFDALGRPFLTVAHNKVVCAGHDLDGTEERFRTRVELDIEGNQRVVFDERRLPNAEGLPLGALEQRIVMRYAYDMLGNRMHQASMEAGERWMLNDVTGKPIRAFDSHGHNFRTTYDPLRRPTESFLQESVGTPLLVGRTVYGESQADPETNNLRGKMIQLFDQVGVVTSESYDFKGNLLTSQRQLATDYKRVLDWSAAPALADETFTSSTVCDALNRPLQLTAPHSDRPGTQVNIIRPGYNEANLLERVDANLQGAATPTPFVSDIDYDAKRQRTQITYGNGVVTTYAYDPLTLRLRHLLTQRGAEPLQDLRYTYDPAGNITHIQDDAQQTLFFRNQIVEPSNDYTYDALYRLIEANGREHLGQTGGQFNPPTPPDAFNRFHIGHDQPNDQAAMGTYAERYVYDAVGNFLAMQHRGSDPKHPGWTRDYSYNEPSLLETGKASNRLTSLTSTTILGVDEVYSKAGDGYDAHGNMLKLRHLPLMVWDYRDQLQATSQQVVTNGSTPEITYYVYDASGQRTRKVTERQTDPGKTPVIKEERLYLGGFEVFRQYSGNSQTVELERETLHIMDDQQRIALVETRTRGNDGSPEQLIRFQLGNHLGSASLELDHGARIISYEEYSPYGSTVYQAARAGLEKNPKRYRYTGMDRDEESGLYYHGTRYYATWIARWTSVDPAGINGGLNVYEYTYNNPLRYIDANGMQPVVFELPGDPAGPAPIQTIDFGTSCPGLVGCDEIDNDSSETKSKPELPEPLYNEGLYQYIHRIQKMGPWTVEGQIMKDAVEYRTGFPVKDFNYDTLAAKKYPFKLVMEIVNNSQSAQRNIDEYNAGLNALGSFSAHVGDAIWFWCPGCSANARRAWGIKSGDANSTAAAVGSVLGIAISALIPSPTSVAKINGAAAETNASSTVTTDAAALSRSSIANTNASSAGATGAAGNVAPTVLSGHGTMLPGPGPVVPPGTSITVHAPPGQAISNGLGNFIELGESVPQSYARTYVPGDTLPNLVLHPPGALELVGNPITVSQATPISALLSPNMGDVQWAACLADGACGWIFTIFGPVRR